MVDCINAESPMGRQSESLEEFWESLNKFKEEEDTSGEACVQGSRVEAPRAPPQPIPQASGKQPQRTKAVQAQAQEAKRKAKQVPKPRFKPSGVQSKKRKKLLNPDDIGDESSPSLIDGSEDSEDPPLPLNPPPTEKSKVKQNSNKPFKKTKKRDDAPKEMECVSAADKIADQPLEEEAPAPQDVGPTPQDKDVLEKVCGSTRSRDCSTV